MAVVISDVDVEDLNKKSCIECIVTALLLLNFREIEPDEMLT